MTSTSESLDHFKEESPANVHKYQIFSQNSSRQNALPSRENTSLSFGSSFGMGTNLWSNASNIWRPKNRFLDGSSEEGIDKQNQYLSPVAGRGAEVSSNRLVDMSSSNKSGSKSLLLSSESEFPTTRKTLPWGTSVSRNNAVNSRPPNQVISPLRQQYSDALGGSHQVEINTRPETGRISIINGQHELSSHTLVQAHNNARQPLDLRAIADHLPAFDVHQAVNANLAAFQTNKVSNSPAQHDVGSIEYVDSMAYGKYRGGSMGFTAHDEPEYRNPFHRFLLKGDFNYDAVSPGHNSKPQENFNADYWEKANSSHHPSHSSEGYISGIQSPHRKHMTPQTQEIRESRSKGPFSLQSDPVQVYGDHNFPPYSRSSSFGDTTVTPTTTTTTSDYKRGINSPFYSSSSTPPTGPESYRTGVNSGASSRASHSYSQSYERGPYRDYPNVSFNPPHGFHTSGANTHELAGYPGAMRMNPLAHPYAMPAYINMPALPPASRFQPRDMEHSHVVRSSVLEDFRMNNKTNKRFELRDIYGHVVEFSGDQHGSRFIQLKLETANSDEKDQIFSEIKSNSLQLMTDLFGNYVVQKFFEHGNQAQKKILANQMKGHVLSLSTQMYGCRVVQKALEHVLTDQQASIVKELETHVLKCVKDQNGNHVIQKAIERVPAEHIQFIIAAFTDQVQRLATHPYGCRVIQRMLEHCEEPAKKSILKELYSCVPRLIIDQFGNYVIQHVIENGEADDKHNIVAIVLSQLLVFSKHKYASNVVEKSIEFAQEDQRSEILRRLTSQDENGDSPVLGLMRDQYGNYVIQKILGQLKGQEWEALVNQIKPLMPQLKRFSHGKQIIAIEKLILDDPTTTSLSTSSQSSSLPSTNASTVEGPVISSNTSGSNKPHETQVVLPFAMDSIRT